MATELVEPYPGSRTWGPRTPELAAHVSLGSNRLSPDSTFLTPLPEYEPQPEQMHLIRPLQERSQEHDSREYGRDQCDRTRGDCLVQDRDRDYARNGRDNGRDQQYE